MRRLNLKEYTEIVRNDETGQDVELAYPVRNSLIDTLLAAQLGLSATEALDRDILARKIRACTEDTILIEEADHKKLLAAIETLTGWCRTDIEFLKRIKEAPEVNVKETESKA